MKKLITIVLFSLGSLICSAQQTNTPQNTPQLPTGILTSPNLLMTSMQGSGVTGTTNITTPGGTSGGSTPGYIQSSGTVAFGYVSKTVSYNYAVNTALRNSGMTWTGYVYSWEYLNQDMSRGTLSAKVDFAGTNGTSLYSKNFTLDKTNDGWKTVNGTEAFVDPLAVSNIASLSLSFTGKDDRFWAGYYGPQVRNPSLKVNYTFDSCSSNPLSSPSCLGYAAAYKTQQCTTNPLYATDCPGYAVAYKTQQCTANPLYATDCPGYAEALAAQLAQQCTNNPLSSVDCPGYAAAYKTQQCTANPLYSKDCSGYDQAYLNAQCIKDSLYSTKCEGYATAYAIKYLVNLDSSVTTAVNQQLTTTNEIAKSDPAKVTVVNSTVDSVLSTPSTTSATSTSPASVTSVVRPPDPPAASPTAPSMSAASAPPPPPPPARQEERAQEQKKTDTEVAKVENKSGGNTQNARKEVGAKAAEIAKSAGKAATLEAQVANQGLLVGLMGYVPGFSAYQQAIIPDTNAIEVARAYHKPVVDNRSAQRRLSGANELRWQEMVDSQYERK